MSEAPKSQPAPAAFALARLAVAGFLSVLVPVALFASAREFGWTAEGGTWDRAYGMGAFAAGGLALLVLSFALPAGRPLLPLRPFFVLPRYAAFFVPWVGALIGYLHLAHAMGHPVLPQEQLHYLAANGLAAHDSMVVLLAVVVGAPLAEELLFRGYLQQALDAVLGARLSLWATAALFGLMHGTEYALPLAVFGLFLGWLRNHCGSLGAPMLAHALHNGLTALAAILWPESLDWMYPR